MKSAGNRATVLVVDDEPQVLAALQDSLEEDFNVLTAGSPQAAMKVVETEQNLSVILSDQRMPGEPGNEFLAKAREITDATRILITGYADIDAVVAAVNDGKIFGYVSKPWDTAGLRIVVYKAVEHHALTRELREREERFRQLAENIRDVFWMVDAKTSKGIYVSPAYEEIWGRPRESLRHNPDSWLKAVHPDDRATVRRARDGAKGAPVETTLEFRVVRPDGSVRWVRERSFPISGSDGKVYRIAGVAEDMTERKEAETTLRETNEKLSALINSSPLAIGMLDPEANVLLWNPAAERMFGWTATEVVGHPYPIVPKSEWDDFVVRFRKNVEGEAISGLEQRRQRKDGSIIDVALWTTPLTDAEGRFFAGLFMMADITERKAQDVKIERLTRIYAVLSGINSAIVRIHDRQALFDEACRIAVDHGRFEMAWILKLDPGTMNVTTVSSAGEPADLRLVSELKRAGPGPAIASGTVGRSVKEQRPVYCNDMQKEPDAGLARKELLRRGYRSVISLPLLPGGECFGVMVLYTKQPDVFDELELKLLTELAGDISFGLEYINKEEQATYLAYHDPLTGLGNRVMLHDRLGMLVDDAAKESRRLALVMLDIDRFKFVNNTLGRNIGDALLRRLADRLTSAVGDAGRVARIGADQFAVALPDVRHANHAARMVEEQVLRCLSDPFHLSNQDLRVAGKVGIALYPEDGTDADTLFRNAEAAVKKAKNSGDRYLFFTQQMMEKVAEKLALENELRSALESHEFVLHYQPKVELSSGRISGLEALIRWRHPLRGLVPPMDFIPLLEETGLILEVGEWALDQAATDYREWRNGNLMPPRIAVNVSTIQLKQRTFVERAEQAIRRRGEVVTLDLEITESTIMENMEEDMSKLLQLKLAGIGIVVDDFGTGYSSLSYIAQMPINALKIDRSFVDGMTTSLHSRLIVSTIISLAHALGLKVVAEGVDTEEKLRVLKDLECDEVQGFLFSKPLPAEEIVALLRRDSVLLTH